MNLYQIAREMQNPIMIDFMKELNFSGDSEDFNIEDDAYGWLFKIYQDITTMEDIEWFSGYDCDLSEFGFGKFVVTKDPYDTGVKNYHFGIDKQHIASGSALWIIANVNHTLDKKLEGKE